MSALHTDVLIVGAGVAGLSAAVALSGAGASVALLDRKPYVGGRAYSYPHPALNEVIDSQHVLVGCCTNLLDLCARSGADRHLRWYDRIPFLEPSTAGRPSRMSEIGAGSLPAPAHSTFSFLQAKMLSSADKVGIATALLHFLRGYPETDEQPFSEWILRAKQSDRSIRHFWEPLVVATLNDSFENCSTRYAGQVFHELFLKSAQGGRQGIPTQPLSEFYAPVAQLAEQQGTVLHLRNSIDRIEQLAGGRWRAHTSDGSAHTAANLLLALPFEQTQKLLTTLPESSPQRQQILPSIEHFKHAPMTTVHLWLDRSVMDLDQAALLDTRIQWVFNKSRIRRDEPAASSQPGEYLELVIAASFAELHSTREAILSSAMEELALFFPSVRSAKLIKSGVLKEARATFSVLPGLDRYRPLADAGGGLFLAGDWTRTGWPSTMEGAARSGRLAAEGIAGAAGSPTRFLTPDLLPSGLMRWLVPSP
ncbi:MAG: hydroxysqualene dehydroxylase HpnE [Acidobacteriota bacterium]